MRFGPDRDDLRDRVLRVISGIRPFCIDRNGLIAFPGETRTRITCDLATGGVGIALFINRFVTGGEAAFMLDEVSESKATPAYAVGSGAIG